MTWIHESVAWLHCDLDFLNLKRSVTDEIAYKKRSLYTAICGQLWKRKQAHSIVGPYYHHASHHHLFRERVTFSSQFCYTFDHHTTFSLTSYTFPALLTPPRYIFKPFSPRFCCPLHVTPLSHFSRAFRTTLPAMTCSRHFYRDFTDTSEAFCELLDFSPECWWFSCTKLLGSSARSMFQTATCSFILTIFFPFCTTLL